MKKLKLVLALVAAISLVYIVLNAGKEKAYDCKVLETYRTPAGYKVPADFILVVDIIKLNKTYSISVSPDDFYKATKYKESGKIVAYNFSLRQVDDLEGTHNDNYLSLSFLVFLSCIALTFLRGFYKSLENL